MAELEMLPAWAGRLAEPTHPPQPPAPPRRSANGHGPAVLAGQPPLPSGEHRLEPEPDALVPAPDDDDGGGAEDGEEDDGAEARLAAMTTSELPVVSIPFDDETTPAPEPPAPDDDLLVDDSSVIDASSVIDDSSLIDTVEAPVVDHLIVEQPADDRIVDAELVDESEPAADTVADEIVYEPDEIELQPEDTDPIGVSTEDNSPVVAPVTAPDPEREWSQGRQDQATERDRPAVRVLGLVALALLVVAAGVAAGYLFVALTGS